MAGHGHQFKIAPASILSASLLICLPALLGQGCPSGGSGIIPINSGSPIPGIGTNGSSTGTGGSVSTGNIAPRLTFTSPLIDVSAEVGEQVVFSWTDDDPDNNASITIWVDPDRTIGNGNEIVVLTGRMEDDDASGDMFTLDTGSLQPATYRIIAQITDGVNPEVLVTAPGRLLLFGAGLKPGNTSPSITVLEPVFNLGVAQGDVVNIVVCGRDPDDDGGTPAQNPDIVLLLDLDDDPTNDLNLTGPSGEALLDSICLSGFFPVEVPGALVIGCLKDNDCGQPTRVPATDADGNPITDANGDPVFTTIFSPGQEFQLFVDVGVIPPRDNGDPYRIRATMWDHVNRPVHAYAPGSLNITALGSGTIDLARIGRTLSGTRFLGFDAGARAGSTGVSLGDFDEDGVDDFIIVARYGRPFERGNVGMAYLVYGNPPLTGQSGAGQKFGSEVYLNAIGTGYRGAGFAMGRASSIASPTAATEGLVSIGIIPDLTGDNRPEIIFGFPYVEELYDNHDDDPCDGEGCYSDYFPNPFRTAEPANDDMTAWDYREAGICTNDLDLLRSTPIDQGYVLYVRSDNQLDGNVIDLSLVGQKDTDGVGTDEGLAVSGSATPSGARFRGGWYDDFDFTQTVHPYAITPDNRFGETVASLPDMSNGSISPARDGRAELLMSAPNMYKGRGGIIMAFGQEYSTFLGDDPIASIPPYFKIGDCGRSFTFPSDRRIVGGAIGDQLGYASSGTDFNLDGHADILCGAPGADRGGINDAGTVYLLFGRLEFGDIDLGSMNPPRMEIRGTSPNDRFGAMQTVLGDVNLDGLPEIGFASQYADGPGGIDAGTIGIILSGRRMTGENIFTVDQVTGPQLPGVLFYGTQPGGRAGAVINNAGDFNGDSIDDLLICAPSEIRTVDGLARRGVAYLIFGGPHLRNGRFSLDQVGTAALPGIVFVSPYMLGSADEAPIDWAGAAGDVNADGFDDIMLGISEADFVNPLEPSQRRIDSGEMYLIYGSNTGSNVVR